MTLPLVQFQAPVVVDPDSQLEATEMLILEIEDKPSLQQLTVVLSFRTEPPTVGRLLAYQGEEYTDLGDWLYEDLCDRIQLYYENDRSFPHYVSPNSIDPTLNQAEELPPEGDTDTDPEE
jgi:hypothetical protein